MRKRTSLASGWVVEVATVLASEDPPKFKYYNVAINDEAKAVEAMRKHLGNTSADRIEAIRGLSAGEIAAIGLEKGEVRPA